MKRWIVGSAYIFSILVISIAGRSYVDSKVDGITSFCNEISPIIDALGKSAQISITNDIQPEIYYKLIFCLDPGISIVDSTAVRLLLSDNEKARILSGFEFLHSAKFDGSFIHLYKLNE